MTNTDTAKRITERLVDILVAIQILTAVVAAATWGWQGVFMVVGVMWGIAILFIVARDQRDRRR